ncbi:MAG: hypothetical protein ACHQ2Y_03925 [Candidatus Lutacidiplasmatales archaeon]
MELDRPDLPRPTEVLHGLERGLTAVVDDVTERIWALVGWSAPTYVGFNGATQLRARTSLALNADQEFPNLSVDHEPPIRSARPNAVGRVEHCDTCPNDFLIGLMEQNENLA